MGHFAPSWMGAWGSCWAWRPTLGAAGRGGPGGSRGLASLLGPGLQAWLCLQSSPAPHGHCGNGLSGGLTRLALTALCLRGPPNPHFFRFVEEESRVREARKLLTARQSWGWKHSLAQ